MEKKSPTVYDIARVAGVSIATVSRVLNNSEIVRQSTRQTVLKVAQDLGYLHEKYPASLPNGDENKLIVVNFPSLFNPFYSDVIRGAQHAARRSGYDLLVYPRELYDNNANNFLDLLKDIKAAGVLMINSVEPRVLNRISSVHPLVQVCENSDSTGKISFVGIDNITAINEVVDYLLSLGHKDIALVCGPVDNYYSKYRKKGFINSMNKAGIRIRPEWILYVTDIDSTAAMPVVRHLFRDKDKKPSAVVCMSDVLAAAVIRAAKDVGLAVPDDVAVTGFDNISLAESITPTLTTVRQPRYEMGNMAGELLIKQIEDPSAEPQFLLLNTDLIIREST